MIEHDWHVKWEEISPVSTRGECYPRAPPPNSLLRTYKMNRTIIRITMTRHMVVTLSIHLPMPSRPDHTDIVPTIESSVDCRRVRIILSPFCLLGSPRSGPRRECRLLSVVVIGAPRLGQAASRDRLAMPRSLVGNRCLPS